MKRIITVFILFTAIFALSSCGALDGLRGEKGDMGVQGEPGPMGMQGEKGEPGNTPYIGENGNWWIAGEDTGYSAQGEPGPMGAPGAMGIPGEKGEQGEPGNTPYIGENGNWWIDGEDTGKSASGNSEQEECDHFWNSFTLAEHTIDSEGAVLRVCEDCGFAQLETISHDYSATETVASTCTEEGYTVYSCECGSSYSGDYLDKSSHVPGEKQYIKNEAGICACEWENPYVIYCETCGSDIEWGQEGAIGHVYGEEQLVEYTFSGASDSGSTAFYISECDKCSCHVTYKSDATEEMKEHTCNISFDEVTLYFVENGYDYVVFKCSVCDKWVKE